MANEHSVAESGKTIVPINEKYMLTIKEASEYFNIGVKKMRRQRIISVGLRFTAETAIS